MENVFLLLGSNRGERSVLLARARKLIAELAGRVLRVSAVYESEPWGFEDETLFLNQVVEIKTELAAEDLLTCLLEIEKQLGRVRQGSGYGARTMDIDILFYGSQIISTARLTVPHPRLHERRFTLVPLAEIAIAFVHPVLGETIGEILGRIEGKKV